MFKIGKVIITNGTGGSGKDEFAKILNNHIPCVKYSSIDLIKEIATLGGWDGGKTEKDRKFLSDLKILFTEYNDAPFNDIKEIVDNFNDGYLETQLLVVDIREPNEIERAKKEFNAITVLVKNDNVKPITSNMADANVLNYNYDYIVDNSGTLEDLENEVFKFSEWMLDLMYETI